MAAGTILSFCGLTVFPGLGGRDQAAASRRELTVVLQGMALGAVIGFVFPWRQGRRMSATVVGNSWRECVVCHKQRESEEISSFHLRPCDGGPLPVFAPGQFLPIELMIPGQTKPVVRTYSLSDYPLGGAVPDHYRLSIKREPAPSGQAVPAGLASNYLHDHVEIGSRIRMLPPAGSFVLDSNATTPIVLISNGVGITPMITMAKAALQQPGKRQVLFVHGCRSGRFHAFADEIAALASRHDNLRVHVAYSRPEPSDQGRYQSEGRVDGALIQRLVDGEADYFICGSPSFMDSLLQELKLAGVNDAAIHYESFSRSPGAEPASRQPPSEVQFNRSTRTATWSGDDPEQSLLSLAEAEGLSPPFACRAGVCGTCATRLLQGEVEYLSKPSASRQPGEVLICIARPATRIISLDL